MFPLIDLARGFAALTVLVYHLIGHWEWTAFPETGPLAWFRGGWMAVDLFFVISGFVIGLSAFARVGAGTAAFRAPFLRSRLARIVPLHWLALAVYVAAIEPGLWQHAGFAADLLAHLLFVHNLFYPYFGSINGPNWSLGTEMQFYLLVALAAPWLARARPWRIALLFVAIAWAWRWGAWVRTLPGPLDVPYWAQTQLPGMLDEFAIGLLLARFVRSARGARVLERVGADLRLRAACAGAAALAWWALMTVFQAHDYWQEPAMAVFFRTAVAACAGLTLWLLCAWPQPRRRWLLAGPLYLGKVSYGIYLWHLPVLFFLGRHTRLEPLVALCVAVPATVGLAALSWHFWEQPLLRFLAARSGGGQASASIVGTVQARTPPAAAALHET